MHGATHGMAAISDRKMALQLRGIRSVTYTQSISSASAQIQDRLTENERGAERWGNSDQQEMAALHVVAHDGLRHCVACVAHLSVVIISINCCLTDIDLFSKRKIDDRSIN